VWLISGPPGRGIPLRAGSLVTFFSEGGLVDPPLRASCCMLVQPSGGGVPVLVQLRPSSKALSVLAVLLRGSSQAVLHCAHRATTASSWGLCEQEGRSGCSLFSLLLRPRAPGAQDRHGRPSTSSRSASTGDQPGRPLPLSPTTLPERARGGSIQRRPTDQTYPPPGRDWHKIAVRRPRLRPRFCSSMTSSPSCR
jgi:hypothetical protein